MVVVSLVKAEMEGDEEGTKAELSSHVDLGRCPVWREKYGGTAEYSVPPYIHLFSMTTTSFILFVIDVLLRTSQVNE
jgi:hypothetical protein